MSEAHEESPDDPLEPGREDTSSFSSELSSECNIFVRYVLGVTASDYLIHNYVAAHRARPEELGFTEDTFGRLLLERARKGPGWTWLVDCYSRVFRTECLLRRKLVLLLALLECSPSGSRHFRQSCEASPLRTVAELAMRATNFAAGLILASVLFLPLRARAAFRETNESSRTEAPDRLSSDSQNQTRTSTTDT